MSSPARQVRARPAEKPRVRTSPSPSKRSASASKPRPKQVVAQKPSSNRKALVRAHRRTALFYVFATILLLGMVFGLATVNAVLAQGAFHLQALTEQEASLSQQEGQLRREIDDLSSPARLTAAAAKAGLIFPDTNSIQVVHSGKDGASQARHQGKKATQNPAIPGNKAQPSPALPGGPE